MQIFNDNSGIRRLMVISNMKVEEVEEYYHSHFYKEPEEKRNKYISDMKERIKAQQKEVDEWILAIHTKDGKLIGKMEICSSNSEVAFLRIEIPNEVLSFQYGVAAIKQFRKICAENNYFERIELESNEITERYKRAYNVDSEFQVKYA